MSTSKSLSVQTLAKRGSVSTLSPGPCSSVSPASSPSFVFFLFRRSSSRLTFSARSLLTLTAVSSRRARMRDSDFFSSFSLMAFSRCSAYANGLAMRRAASYSLSETK